MMMMMMLVACVGVVFGTSLCGEVPAWGNTSLSWSICTNAVFLWLLEGCAQTPETLEINFVNGRWLFYFFFLLIHMSIYIKLSVEI